MTAPAHQTGGDRPHRVLVVEDEPLILWALTQTLEDRGFAVQQAASAADAVACAATDQPCHVVLLDFRLPDSNDLGLLRRLRQMLPHAPVVLMTAFSTPEVVQEALDLGVTLVMGKPFEMNDMADLVARLS